MQRKKMTTNERSWWWVKKKKQMALVVIIVTMMLQLQMKGSVGCLETERIGLLQLKSYLKNVLNAEEEIILESWSHDASNSDCCLWESVKCSDTIGGHIVDLSLSEIITYSDQPPPRSLNLSLLHSFPELQSLDLSFNLFSDLFDPVHGYKSLQRLDKLRTLNLYYNLLNNSVLPFISAARSLRTLDFGLNRLEGVFPPNELANMTELRVLNLGSNGFTFFSVQGLINLWELEVLDLSGNNINDVQAGDGLRTTNLKRLDLSSNKFSDNARLKGLENFVELKVLILASNEFNHIRSIQVLKDMPTLLEVDLYGNQFPDLDSLDAVFPSSLQLLDLAHNQLSLTPKGYSKICALMNLQKLGLSNNALTSLPYCLGNLTRLRTLGLSDNQLNGNLFSFVSGLPSKLEYLSLLENNFNDSFLFNSLVNQTRLKVFKLSSKVGMIQTQAENSWVPLFQLKMLKLQNFILGSTIPGFLVHQRNLVFIDLSHNNLSGAFPAWLLENNTRLKTILMNSNSLTELQLPRLVHGLQFLDISSNRIHNSIQEDIGIVFPNLRVMNFSSNRFQGTIPSSMAEMKSLRYFDMSTNGLFGQLPNFFLSGCYSLWVLRLSNNQFQGEIFPEHTNLTGLEWLALDGNNFNGSLGKSLLNSENLFVLDISDNSISGTLPRWIGRMSSLMFLYMRGNQLKGPFPRQLQNLVQLEVMDISNNSFSGSIPRNINFPFLRRLRLQSNEFTGSIPGNLFKATRLDVLDLRNNKFSGMILNDKGSNLRILLLGNNNFQTHIPEKICKLSKVALMDLSHNNFKGVILSCLDNMSFGAESEDNLDSFDSNFGFGGIPNSQNWRYTASLNLHYSDLEDGFHTTPTTIAISKKTFLLIVRKEI